MLENKTYKENEENSRKRIRARVIFFSSTLLVFYFIICWRLFFIQVWENETWLSKARRAHLKRKEIKKKRGSIYDRGLNELAVSMELKSVYLNSLEFDFKQGNINKICSVLQISPEKIIKNQKSKKQFIWLKRQIEDEVADKLKDLKIPGIHFQEEYKRFYPKKFLASQVLGFVNIDGDGLEGVEYKYNNILVSTPGWIKSERDPTGLFEIPEGKKEVIKSSGGYNVYLTIDEMIQHIVEQELKNICKKYNPLDAFCIVMEPQTGSILAMANYPTFNNNDRSIVGKASKTVNPLRNRCIGKNFEPGSTFKIISIASALEEGLVDLKEKFECGGRVVVSKNRSGKEFLIHCINKKKHGLVNVEDIITKSCNVGTVKIARRFTRNTFYNYIKKFGFGQKTGIDLPGEEKGILRKPRQWSGLTQTSMSIGQEIGVTGIQLITAVSAIINKGTLLKPRIIKKIEDSKGRVIKEFPPMPIRQVVSESTCEKVISLLKNVVKEGTGKRAAIKWTDVGAKTGTAQKAGAKGYKEGKNKNILSFIGFVPVSDPRILALVVLDEPKSKKRLFAGTIAAPVFQSIAKKILEYLRVIPEKDDYIGIKRAIYESDLKDIPNLVGKSLEKSVKILKKMGLKVDIYGAGAKVIYQNPPPGVKVEPKSTVKIYLTPM